MQREVICLVQLWLESDWVRSRELISLRYSRWFHHLCRGLGFMVRLNSVNVPPNSFVFIACLKSISIDLSLRFKFRSVTFTLFFDIINLLLVQILLFHLNASFQILVKLPLLLLQSLFTSLSFLHLLLELFLVSEFRLLLRRVDLIMSLGDVSSHSDTRIASTLHHLLRLTALGRWRHEIVSEWCRCL